MSETRRELSEYARKLRIHIIGAGMGGMGSALALANEGFSNIHVWEAAMQLGEVGAGINVTPNLSRILDRWKVLGVVTNEAVALRGASVLKNSSDEVLTSVDFKYIEQEFGYPFYTVHRSALQKSLVKGAEKAGVVQLHLNSMVEEYDVDNTRLKVRKNVGNNKDGQQEWIEADVILAADGVKSKARSVLLSRSGEKDDVVDTGQAAYRILVQREMIKEDPELVPFFTSSHSFRWIGEKRHIIAYPIASGKIFNMSTAHPDRHFVAADAWTTSGSKEEMLSTFSDFCPRVQKLLELVPEGDVLEWKLRVHSPIAKWVDNHMALVGDACHPTLPHLAQGAAQAIEDAAVLGVVLSNVKKEEDIHVALVAYQELRKPRADWAVAAAAANGRGLHLARGTTQEERDRAFRSANKSGGENPDKAIDKKVQSTLYAYDSQKEATLYCATLFKDL